MKKRVIIIAAFALIALSGLSDIALSLAEESQWNPYVLRWDKKLHEVRRKKVAKAKPIPVCSSKSDQRSAN